MTIVRVEGLSSNKAICKLFLNNEFVDSVVLNELEDKMHTLSVPNKGKLNIRIENCTSPMGLDFELDIIKCEGYHWLPLLPEDKSEISQVPEEVGLPRILLIFQISQVLSPVIEVTETSELSENIEPVDLFDSCKNVELELRVLELEKALKFEKKSQLKSIEKIITDYSQVLQKNQVEIEKYKSWTENYKEKCFVLNKELDLKTKNIQMIKEEKDLLTAELTLYKQKYIESIRNLESLYNLLDEKEKIIEELRNWNKNSDFSKQESVEIFRSKKAKAKLINFSLDSVSESFNEKLEKIDKVGDCLSLALKELNLEGFFLKTTETFYKVGCKRVAVVMKNNKIFCKFGEKFETLEKFIYSHCSHEMENFIKNRVAKNPGHKKSMSGTFDYGVKSESKASEKKKGGNVGNEKSISPSRSRLRIVKNIFY